MEYSSFEERLQTFTDVRWPTSSTSEREMPSGEDLAMEGYFYNTNKYEVQCYLCNASFDYWGFGENVIQHEMLRELHREKSPHCPMNVRNLNTFPNSNRQVSSQQPENLELGNSVTCHPDRLPEYMRLPNQELLIKESERLKTYGSDWSQRSSIKSDDLARAGFVYLGTRDMVQCIFCYAIIENWERSEIPFQVHCRRRPTCPFVRGDNTPNISLENEIRILYTDAHRPLTPVCLPGLDVSSSRPVNRNLFGTRRDGASAQRDGASAQRDGASAQRDGASAQRDGASAQRDGASAQRDGASAQRDGASTQRDSERYASKTARTQSFESWPRKTPQNVSPLVDSGFFYTGFKNYVQCFKCGVRKAWKAKHGCELGFVKWHPNCPFYLTDNGHECVECTNRELLREFIEERLLMEQTWSMSARLHARPSSPHLLELAPGAEREARRKIQEKRVRKALIYDGTWGFPTADLLQKRLLQKKADTSIVPSSSAAIAPDVQVASTSKDSSTDLGATSLNSSADSATLPEYRLCKVCMDKEICVVLLPCSHFVACKSCAQIMRNCPICRGTIDTTLDIYWS